MVGWALFRYLTNSFSLHPRHKYIIDIAHAAIGVVWWGNLPGVVRSSKSTIGGCHSCPQSGASITWWYMWYVTELKIVLGECRS